MKKCRPYLHLFLVAFYLLSSVGIPVYYHYCGGELESISALVKTDSCCGGEETEEDSGCCQNELKVLVQQNESVPAEKYLIQQFEAPNAVIPVKNDLLTNFETSPSFTRFIPPDLVSQGRALLLRKSVLII